MARLAMPVALLLLGACTGQPTMQPGQPRGRTWAPASVAVSPNGDLAVGSLENASVTVVPRGRRAPVAVATDRPPVQARFVFPSGLAYADDGTLYVVDTAGRGVWAVGPDGSRTAVRLTGPEGSALKLSHPIGLAAGADGTLWVADTTAHRVLQIDPEGPASVLAGAEEPRPEPAYGGDGGPAAEARLAYPGALALGPDGSLYIADTGNRRIRRVDPDGTIETVAGNGRRRFSGDGGPAVDAGIGTPRGLAIDADGTLYFTAGYRLRRVSPDGTITTEAGTDRRGCAGDGGPAAGARLAYPMGVAVGSDGTLYVADHQNNLIRAVIPGGTIVSAVAFGDPPARSCL